MIFINYILLMIFINYILLITFLKIIFKKILHASICHREKFRAEIALVRGALDLFFIFGVGKLNAREMVKVSRTFIILPVISNIAFNIRIFRQ